jgi:transposase
MEEVAMSELSEELKNIYSKTAQVLKGSERRQFMARIVKTLGRGGQSYAAREFHWGRNTIRKGMQALTSGIPIQDNFAGRGRHKAEEKLPQLLEDLRTIVDGQSQTDPIPLGIFLPQPDRLYLYFTDSQLTSDFMVDCLEDCWRQMRQEFPHVRTLVLNLDNGPENHSRRTQFMKRLTAFVDHFHMTVNLAYYPPYHSKYNPIERVWGVLENHWNGSLLDSCETVLRFAQTFTFRGQLPLLHWLKTVYLTGIRLTQRQMACLETRLERFPALPKWFVRITPILAQL